VARTRFSPLGVKGISVEPVCLPERDHSVSPCRTMKQRGVAIVMDDKIEVEIIAGERWCWGREPKLEVEGGE
jgi:hypothetical protein